MSNISTALKIAEATQDAVHNQEVMEMAREMLRKITLSEPHEFRDEQIRAVFEYSATLASATATFVSSAILGDNDFDNMVESVQEFEELERDIFG